MAKKQKRPTKTCTDCIHESACRVWTGGRVISDVTASQCPSHETVKESGAYLCGVLDERKRKQTNADRIRAMSDEELAEWLARTQIANIAEALAVAKIPYEPEDGLKDEVAKECMEWLKQPAEVSENG